MGRSQFRGTCITGFLAALLLVLCDGRVAKAQDSIPVEDQVYRHSIRFEERDWALPQGDWRLLVYIPNISPFGAGRSFRVALGRFDTNGSVIAIVIYAVGEVGNNAPSTASTNRECIPGGLPFRQEAQISDNASDYACWTLREVDLSKPTDEPLFNAIKSKIEKQVKITAPFLSIEMVKKQDGRLAHHAILFNPAFLKVSEAGASLHPLGPSGNSGADPGTTLAIHQILREWAIRWERNFVLSFTAKLTPRDNDLAVPLPVLNSSNDEIPVPPRIKVEKNASFKDSVPIGPFRIPLPNGVWNVALHNPQLYADGSVGIEQVTLTHVEGSRLDGMIQIEARLASDAAIKDACSRSEARVVYHEGPDEFCALTNWIHVYRDDSKFPLYQELNQQKIATPNSLIGSLFSFSNKLVVYNVYVAFSPEHVGLPDFAGENHGVVPREWAPFAAKWQRWTQDWSEAMESGFAGLLPTGPLPPAWRDADLKSEFSTPLVQPNIGDTYVGTVPLGGRNWPLPPGQWTAVATIPQLVDDDILADQIYLMKVSQHDVVGMISVAVSRPDTQTPVDTVNDVCALTPNVWNRRLQMDLGVRQDCWSLSIHQIPQLRAMHGFEAFEGEVKSRGLAMPKLVLETNFVIVDRYRSAFLSYGFSAATLAKSLHPDDANDIMRWYPSHGAIGPVREQVYRSMLEWSAAWHDAINSGFAGTLGQGPLPPPWKGLSADRATAGVSSGH